ncbi:MAG: PASTA domain-containing protein [Rikenellaceae bacterium]|nr:PASTA domain-containing protein [Rikenellaceae bacterium]
MKSNTNQKSGLRKLLSNTIVRHLILVTCSVIILVFIATSLLNILTRHNQQIEVPNYVGLELAEVREMAKEHNFEIHINDSLYVPAHKGGVVLDQNPKAGSHVKSGRRIFIMINSYNQRQVQLPYVTGYSLRQAKNILEVSGLGIDEICYVPDIATNYVIEQRVGGKVVTEESTQKVYVGSNVTLIVGQNPADDPTVITPKVVGLSLNEAKSRLWERGLNVGSVRFDEGIDVFDQNDAKVYIQTPGQAEFATLGQKVTLRLTLDQEVVNKSSVTSDRDAKKLIEERVKAAEDSLNVDGVEPIE